ncbi:MAG TPA: hypothetical protein GX735_04310 [Firmicutes bacterium]|nr:hypothetical protein [Bacillota bacterium]
MIRHRQGTKKIGSSFRGVAFRRGVKETGEFEQDSGAIVGEVLTASYYIVDN